MSYITPVQDMRDTLIADNVFVARQTYYDFLPDPTEGNYAATLIQTGGDSNPRWAVDQVFITIQVLGKDRSTTGEVRDTIWAAYNALVGRHTFQKGDYVYTQFNSVKLPTFVGYKDNSKPLYTCSVSFVREAQVKEGNRDPLC